MKAVLPTHLLLISLAGWMNRHQQAMLEYVVEENRVLKEQLRGTRLRLTMINVADSQRKARGSGVRRSTKWRPS